LLQAAQIGLALALAVLGAWLATRGAVDLAQQNRRLSAIAIAATLVSVALALPMASLGAILAANKQTWIPLTAQVGVVYLNLCVLMPLVILLNSAAGMVARYIKAPTTQSMWAAVAFPRVSWRIDSVGLVILSLVFVAAAAGRIRFNRRVAASLIIAYCVYLMCVAAMSMIA